MDRAHPDQCIHSITVVRAPDERWGQIPCGVIVLELGAELDAAALEEFGRKRLAALQVPRRWVAVEELPQTRSGKLRKVDLERRTRELLSEVDGRS